MDLEEKVAQLQAEVETLKTQLAEIQNRLLKLEAKKTKTTDEEGMKRTPVESSMMYMVGYDAKEKILEIQFNSGKTYHYYDVPAKVYRELMKSDSKGSYFREEIDNTFDYNQVKLGGRRK